MLFLCLTDAQLRCRRRRRYLVSKSIYLFFPLEDDSFPKQRGLPEHQPQPHAMYKSIVYHKTQISSDIF